MKIFFYLLFLLSTADFVHAQIAADTIYSDVDEAAQFPGGKAKMMKFIGENLHYPESDIDYGISGKIWMRFVVEKDGTITQVKVTHGNDENREFDKEAKRLVQSMPKWIPGKVNGKIVRSYFDLPITICLQ